MSEQPIRQYAVPKNGTLFTEASQGDIPFTQPNEIEVDMSETVEVPLSVVVEVWRLLSSLGVSLADLGQWESEPRVDERFTAGVYNDFLTGFDVTRKLLTARRLLSSILEQRVGADRLDALAEPIEYWEWQPNEM